VAPERIEAERVRLFKRKLVVNLALQGGGAHGAFTWGVLDLLLEDETVEIGWISGTSAGAVNAVALAAGVAEAGREGGRAKLRQVWDGVLKAGVPDLLRLNPFLYSLSRSPAMAQVASLLSPYDFNPLGFDPLRRLLVESIDFAKVRSGPIELLIAATEVETGHARLFRRQGMRVEAVLASACLPTIHHADEIEGVAYWDGGFSANPDLDTLAIESPVADTLIVKLSPLHRPGTPTGVREIAGHVNRLTFNAPLLRDIEIIETVRATSRGPFGVRRGPLSALARHRFHLIDAGRYTARLSADTKIKPDAGLLSHLFGAGRGEADKWLLAVRPHIGRRSSVDLGRRFLSPQGARDEAVANQERPAGQADDDPEAPAAGGTSRA